MQTNPRDANSMPNRARVKFEQCKILENEPVGSIIGVFSGTDRRGCVELPPQYMVCIIRRIQARSDI